MGSLPYSKQRYATDQTKRLHKGAKALVETEGKNGVYEDHWLEIKSQNNGENIFVYLPGKQDTMVMNSRAWGAMVHTFRPGAWTEHLERLIAVVNTRIAFRKEQAAAIEALCFEPIDDSDIFRHAAA